MHKANKSISLLAGAVLAVASLTTRTVSQDTVPSIDSLFTENSFVEIALSPEEIVAYDSLGNRWVYDFEQAIFVPSGDEPPGIDSPDRVQPVEERCTEKKLVAIHEKIVLVGYDEYVDGDIVAYDRVTVKGWVKGSVRSQIGKVLVTESGRVDGDIRAPGIIVKDGGLVSGELVFTDPLEIPYEVLTRGFSTHGIWVVFGFTLFFLVAGFLLTSLMPRQVRNVSACLSAYPFRSFSIGFVVVVFGPVFLSVTIIGVLLVPLVPIAYLVALLFAMITSGMLIQRLFRFGTPGDKGSLYTRGLVGIALFMVLWGAVAVLLGSSGSAINAFGTALLVISILISSGALCAGAGAAAMTRFGFRTYLARGDLEEDKGPEEPAPPPIPDAPPLDSLHLPDTPPGPSDSDLSGDRIWPNSDNDSSPGPISLPDK
ncbi:MAG: polymer-forming cytoskeletal protein [Candidatus Zixiibacteriota bacterium]|nr:MAG: polymer-forming cytoskeletal protein [candidate division Zixibacteria bacterium]